MKSSGLALANFVAIPTQAGTAAARPTRDVVFNVGAAPNPLGWHVDADCHVIAAFTEAGGLVIVSLDARSSYVSGTVLPNGVVCGGNQAGILAIGINYPLKKDQYLWVYMANVPSRVHVITSLDVAVT